MKSTSRSAGWVAGAVLLVGVLIAATVVAAQNNRINGVPAAEPEFKVYEPFVDLPTAPSEVWSVTVAERGLSADPLSTTAVDGDLLIYLADAEDRTGPGAITLLDGGTGQRKWTVELDDPNSCKALFEVRHIPCYGAVDDRELRFLDLQTGAFTSSVFAENEIRTVKQIGEDDEYLTVVAGPKAGEVTVQRGTRTDIDAAWAATFDLPGEFLQLFVSDDGPWAHLVGLGGAVIVFDTETGVRTDVAPELDRSGGSLWTWSERTKIRVDTRWRTFEILDPAGTVIGRGDDPSDNSPRVTIGTEYEDVALIGTGAYDTTTGERLWSDERLRVADTGRGSFDSNVDAIVNGTVLLRIRGEYPSGVLVGLDLRTGRELWRRDYQAIQLSDFYDSMRWIGIVDGLLQAVDVSTGATVWTLEYPGAAEPELGWDLDRTTLESFDRRRLVVSTETAVTVYEPR